MVNFDAHWTSGTPPKGGFEIPLATDSTRLVVKFLPPSLLKLYKRRYIGVGT